MKGDIRITSKENKGSNFILAFPVKVCKEIAAFSGDIEGERDPNLFKGKTCLLLDDIHENTYVMQEILRNYGLKAICSQIGQEAFDIYTKGSVKIDAIVTDLRMPGMSGQTFILNVRKFERDSNKPPVPIIVVTAESCVDEKRLCLTNYGANDYLIKPIKFSELICSLAKATCTSMKKRKKSKDILVIDDDLLSSECLANILRHSGHKCKKCHSITEAKTCFADNYSKYDVVLLDNLLGDGTGVDFIEFASEFIREKDKPMPTVVSMSGNPPDDQKKMYKGFSLCGYLQKPISKHDLLGIINIV